MDYQEYLNELAEKYNTSIEKIETAVYAFSGGNEELFKEIASATNKDSVSLQHCIEYVKEA